MSVVLNPGSFSGNRLHIHLGFCRLPVILLCSLLSACASFSQYTPDSDASIIYKSIDHNSSTSISSGVPATDVGWWQVGFHRDMEENEDPAWYMDSLIAYEVIKPILDTHKQQIIVWRFHRRAAPDKSGHKFSFIFYSKRSVGESIYELVRENQFVQTLENENYIDRLSFADLNSVARLSMQDTSDKNWPIELQKAWPYFAQGVSQTWLSLIEQYAEQASQIDDLDVVGQVEQFKMINGKIDKLWEQEGGHAFLHHLNALFGYQELYIIERRRMRF
jgi:hypothetical protein